MDKKAANKRAKYKWLARHGNENGIIYQIRDLESGKTYIGCTKLPLKKIWWQAITLANNGKGKAWIHEHIRQKGRNSLIIEEIHVCSPDENMFITKEKFKSRGTF